MQFLAIQLKSPRFQKYFQNISWLLFEKVFTLFVAMLVGVYVARYLQPESFGLLNFSISFVGIFSALSTLGLDQIMVRELAKYPENKDELLGTGFILKLGGASVLILVILLVSFFMGNDKFTNTLILIIAISETFKAFEVVNSYYQSKVMSKYVVQIQLIINFALSASKVAMVFLGAPLIWFAVIVLINTLLNAAGFIYIYKKRDGSLTRWVFKKTLAATLLRESWPLALYGIALHIQARIDQVMLGKMLSNYEVGQYSAALKFIEVFGFVPMVLMTTFTPAVTKAREIGTELYHNRLVNLYRLMFATFLAIAIPTYFLAEDFIVLLYGPEYRAAGVLLSLFAIRLFFTNMGVGKSVFIVNESLFKYSLATTIVGAIVNISVNYIMIPRYASIGAIWATIISFSISIFLIDLFFEKTRQNLKLVFQGIFSFWKLDEVFRETLKRHDPAETGTV